VTNLDALKENTTIDRMGMYRNANPNARQLMMKYERRLVHRVPADRGLNALYHIMKGTSSMSSRIATAARHRPGAVRENSSQSTRPIINAFGPPRSAGMTNSPTAGMNTSMEPASTPFLERGSVIL